MLRAIHLENFKAFGARTTVPLAPITLIFGQNSAGKSSILQALNLLEPIDLKSMGHNSAQYVHTLIEALKLSFADRDRWIADPRF